MIPVVCPSPLAVMIVDDEAPARTRLRDLLADLAPELPNELVAEAENGFRALAAIASRRVDVALIDIQMPRMDGIALACRLSELARPPAVIFVTAFEAYAVQAFELNVVDYLLKPVRAKRLLTALQKVRPHPMRMQVPLASLQQTARSHLSCHERGRLLLIPVAEVIYLKADLKYVTARTRDREYLLDESLTHLEQEFGEQFIRLHRSVLVARETIIGFEKSSSDDAETQWQAMLRDIPERLPISRRQWPLVKSCAHHLTP
ncbi:MULTISPECIES: LytR/AlgR family response regulator transcription factor [Candidatus Accumulibacter]|uniref:Response regulator transcription factor n=2 Tax=Candidatus Accumulibacter TaxID=327159 RepID=A0A7D5N8X4_9PROT|nr:MULTISPECIES: LytTR family DNA-binding domain-containing protein [Candidatus Accumulibacter]MBL8401316.1 response regulator transcription factor [Accumulibacter sp.]MCC2868938.1 LytTR family DNA-binding domain-containing protein [Candidatus Accumulibacter phosphatis]MCM8622939.1 LytTR family DNA-binding domain-containing protein [Accumulibacter sp.]QLH48567.1 MAG: response regulator transcription factor [Candidatus Accumulibacter cognatus]